LLFQGDRYESGNSRFHFCGFSIHQWLGIRTGDSTRNRPGDSAAGTANDWRPAVKAENTPQQQKIADLIKQLAADDFATRDAASNELLKIGPDALPALKEALKSDDPSIQSYAEYLVPRIEGGRDGRRYRIVARAGGGQFGIAANRAGAADMLVARNGRVAINVTANNNVRTANITDGDRQVKIEEGPDGIRMSVTDNDGGRRFKGLRGQVDRGNAQGAARGRSDLRQIHGPRADAGQSADRASHAADAG
jgi:hypothetical protein